VVFNKRNIGHIIIKNTSFKLHGSCYFDYKMAVPICSFSFTATMKQAHKLNFSLWAYELIWWKIQF